MRYWTSNSTSTTDSCSVQYTDFSVRGFGDRVEFSRSIRVTGAHFVEEPTNTESYDSLVDTTLGAVAMGGDFLRAGFSLQDGVLKIDVTTNVFRTADKIPAYALNTVVSATRVYQDFQVSGLRSMFASNKVDAGGLRALYVGLAELAMRNGIELIPELEDAVTNWDPTREHLLWALLNYLMYPMLRETESIGCLVRAQNHEEEFLRRSGNQDFNGLVRQHFGSSSGVLRKKLWKHLIGENTVFGFNRTVGLGLNTYYDLPDCTSTNASPVFQYDTISGNRYAVLVNDSRRFRAHEFLFVSAIHKAFGFDWLYKYLDFANRTVISWITVEVDLVGALKRFAETFGVRKTVLGLAAGDGFGLIEDSNKMLADLGNPEFIPPELKNMRPYVAPKAKTIKEFHDKLAADHRVVVAARNNQPIRYGGVEKTLHGYRHGDLEIVLAESTARLADWAQHFNNCVSSYADRARNGDILIAGVKKDGELLYCMELESLRNGDVWAAGHHGIQQLLESNRAVSRSKDGYAIRQLLGKHNAVLEPKQFDAVALAVYSWYEGLSIGFPKWPKEA